LKKGRKKKRAAISFYPEKKKMRKEKPPPLVTAKRKNLFLFKSGKGGRKNKFHPTHIRKGLADQRRGKGPPPCIGAPEEILFAIGEKGKKKGKNPQGVKKGGATAWRLVGERNEVPELREKKPRRKRVAESLTSSSVKLGGRRRQKEQGACFDPGGRRKKNSIPVAEREKRNSMNFSSKKGGENFSPRPRGAGALDKKKKKLGRKKEDFCRIVDTEGQLCGEGARGEERVGGGGEKVGGHRGEGRVIKE